MVKLYKYRCIYLYNMAKCAFEGCKKKIKLTDYPCKCEKTFCALHKCHVIHQCTYDFKKENKDKLEKLAKIKQNTVIMI